jgi:hypothetical protein
MTPRVFVVDYQFLACGDVFTQGLLHAAQALGLPYAHAEAREKNLEQAILQFHPDLLLVVHGRMATARLRARLPEWTTAVWLLDEPYEVDETSGWSGQYGHTFVCDRATLHRHPRATYLPVCYDPALHTPGTGERPYRVGFIGGANRTRDRFLAALARAGHLSYVVGGDWASPEVRRLCVSRNIPPSQTVAFYQQTQIVVNVFRETHHYNRQGIPATSLNPRVYEAFACGALVVSEWRPEAETLLPEMPTFRTETECVALVAELRADPVRAEAIRAACAARLAPHTYAARLQTVLEVCGVTQPLEVAV